jgi:hypothetical protein
MSMSPFFYAVGLYTWTASNFLRSCYCAPPGTSHVCGTESTRSFRISLLQWSRAGQKSLPDGRGAHEELHLLGPLSAASPCTSSTLRPPWLPSPGPPTGTSAPASCARCCGRLACTRSASWRSAPSSISPSWRPPTVSTSRSASVQVGHNKAPYIGSCVY